jgi:hypothetical protein
MEAACGKRLWDMVDLGAVGYGVWQVTDDSGTAAQPSEEDVKGRVLAAGPEIALNIPDRPIVLKWRGYAQFAVKDRFRGYESIIELYLSF